MIMKSEKNKYDILVTRLTLAILVFTLVFYAFYWFKMPDMIPMHYNLSGQIDCWGSKYESLFIPLGMIVLYVFLAFVEKKPSLWNTGVKITPENQQRIYPILLHFICTTRLIIMLFFAYMMFCTLLAMPLGKWFMVGWILALAADFIFWFYLLFKAR